MPFDYSDKENLQNFDENSNIWNTKFGQKLANSKSANDVGTFVGRFGQENL